MTTTLYHGEPNGPSLSVLAAAFEKGADVTLERIDLVAGARHAALVPRAFEVEQSIEGEGPVLVVDGVAMADSVFLGFGIGIFLHRMTILFEIFGQLLEPTMQVLLLLFEAIVHLP